MDSGRMPACVVRTLAEKDNTSVLGFVPNGTDANNYYPSMQQVGGGNRCGHDKNSFKKPKFHQDHKRRPHAIEEAKRRISQAIADPYRFPEFTGIFYHPVEEEKGGRLRRSESIEGSLSLALTSLIHSLNLTRMAIGFYDNRNQFHYYDCGHIIEATEQNESRVKREMRLLQDYGIIRIDTSRERNNDGSWRTKEVRIEFTDKIFRMLDLMDEFLKDRETLSIKFHEKQARLDHNRKKKELYRKPSFGNPKAAKKPYEGLQKAVAKLTKPYKPQIKGRGLEIRDLYQSLISKGLTPQQASEAVKTKYPPPH